MPSHADYTGIASINSAVRTINTPHAARTNLAFSVPRGVEFILWARLTIRLYRESNGEGENKHAAWNFWGRAQENDEIYVCDSPRDALHFKMTR